MLYNVQISKKNSHPTNTTILLRTKKRTQYIVMCLMKVAQHIEKNPE